MLPMSETQPAQAGFDNLLPGGEPTSSEPTGEPASSEPTGEPASPEPKSGEPTGEPASSEPTGEVKKTPLELVFSDDDGNFSMDSFLSYSLPDSLNIPAPAAEPAPAQPQQTKQAGEELPRWQQEFKADQEHLTTLRDQALGPLEQIAKLMDEGVDPAEALNKIYAEQRSHFENYSREYRYKRDFQRQETERKAAADMAAKVTMQENAKTNVNSFVAAMPGKTEQARADYFNYIMFSPEVGAPLLNTEFFRRNPDVKSLPEAEQKARAEQFILELQANKAELRHFWEMAENKAIRMAQKSTIKQAKQSGVQQERESRFVAQKHPAGSYQAPSSKGGDEWGNYFMDTI